MAGSVKMIDEKTLELIKNNKYSEGVNFPEEVHNLIHDFYENFDLDEQNDEYRKSYIMNFISKNESFLVNYETNVLNVNIKNTDNLSSELTLNKFLSTLAVYLTKSYDYGEQAVTDSQKREA